MGLCHGPVYTWAFRAESDEADHASPGSAATGSGSSSANGTRLPPSPAVRHRWEKKRVITTPARNSPSRRLGPFAVRELQRELGVAAARRERQREGPAEARVDVGHLVASVLLAEALDRRRARRARAPRRRGAPNSIRSRSWIVMPLIDSPPFDWIIVRGIAFRQRPSRSQKTSIENSSPGSRSARTSRPACSRGRSRAPRGRARDRCGASRSPRAPSRAAGSARRRARRPAASSAARGSRAPRRTGARGTCRRPARRRPRPAAGRARRARRATRTSFTWSRSVSGTIRRTSCSATRSRRHGM